MRALTKVTTVVAATAMVLTGMSAIGVANAAAPAVSVSSDLLSATGTLSLTGTILKVDGQYITIALDVSKRKVVVEYADVADVIGQLEPGKKVKVVISALEALLDFVKAQKIITIS